MTLMERALLFYGSKMPNHPKKWWLHEQLRKFFKIQISTPHDVVRNTLQWRLNPADYTDNSLFWYGTRDPWEILHLKKIVKPGSVILDVGANFGYYSLMLASVLERHARIIALEPDPDNFQRLTYHIALNDMSNIIEAQRLGASDVAGEARMTKNPENSGHAMIAADGEIKNIILTTIDLFSSKHLTDRLDLLIIDVEGCEERALIGAEKTLAQFKPVVLVELFPPMMKCQGSSPEKVRDILTSSGYQLFTAKRDQLVPLEEMPTQDSRTYAFCFHSDNLRN